MGRLATPPDNPGPFSECQHRHTTQAPGRRCRRHCLPGRRQRVVCLPELTLPAHANFGVVGFVGDVGDVSFASRHGTASVTVSSRGGERPAAAAASNDGVRQSQFPCGARVVCRCSHSPKRRGFRGGAAQRTPSVAPKATKTKRPRQQNKQAKSDEVSSEAQPDQQRCRKRENEIHDERARERNRRRKSARTKSTTTNAIPRKAES